MPFLIETQSSPEAKRGVFSFNAKIKWNSSIEAVMIDSIALSFWII
jgi:hypothetical protein